MFVTGFGKEFDKRVSEKIFINEHPKEVCINCIR